jgi:hypothetical protein
MNQSKWLSRFIIGTFISLYTLVSIISTIHVIDFFELSNPYWLAVTLAIGFEFGAAASLASLVILDKMNKTLVWALFITITLMQMQGNMYYAFTNLEDFQSWSELFDLIEEEPIFQKRVLAAVSGAILPLVALGFIKSLVDYIKPESEEEFTPEDSTFGSISEEESESTDDWDEDHELDRALNIIADDIEIDPEEIDAWKEEEINEKLDRDFDLSEEEWIDSEEDDVWENTIADGLDDVEFDDDLLDLQESMVNEESKESEDDEDKLAKALREKAKEEMKDFVKQKRNGSSTSNRA